MKRLVTTMIFGGFLFFIYLRDKVNKTKEQKTINKDNLTYGEKRIKI